MTALLFSNDVPVTKAGRIGIIIDHLVDALGGDPSSSLRRTLILSDIDQNPGTSQSEIMKRIDIDKSSLNRDIDWLFDYGCIYREQSVEDARSIKLKTIGYSKKHLRLALEYFGNSQENLKQFLYQYIELFSFYGIKPTLRDAKILAAFVDKNKITRRGILDELYSGPASTESRALSNLMEAGLIRKVANG